VGEHAGRPAGRRRRRQRWRASWAPAPCIGLGWGGCGLRVTLTAPPSFPLLYVAAAWAGWALQATRAVNRPAGPRVEASGPQAAKLSCFQSSENPPQLCKSSENPPVFEFSPQAFILYIFRLN
jgi:hypothetical protein